MQSTHTCGSRMMGVPLRLDGRSRHAAPARGALICTAGTSYSKAARPERSPVQQHKDWGVDSLGPDLWNTTYYPKAEHAKSEVKEWFYIDAAGQTLGRLSTLAANHLRGKCTNTFTPSMDMGAYVVVVNADKVTVTGKKAEQKNYYRHSHRPGSLKTENFKHLQRRIPERIVEHAVRGMLPKNRIGRHLFTHLKVYKGSEHPHTAQRPQPITPEINLNRLELSQLLS